VDLVAKAKGDESTEWLRRVHAADPSAAIQRKAAAALKARGVAGVTEPPLTLTHSPHAKLRFDRNPVVVLETTRGRMVLEVFAREAPVHAANFVGHVRRGFYDGLTWHRVVPNFVIQGGDPIGTGWGNAGYTIRAEINDKRYARGAMGMPRTADFDTGGCQVFITHIPTPHLDGLYTVFAQVVDGFEVIDRIERGDRIVRAYERP
jgi:cyclophilin family peptidyl-prolyl cis-trans isomerase